MCEALAIQTSAQSDKHVSAHIKLAKASHTATPGQWGGGAGGGEQYITPSQGENLLHAYEQ